MKTSTQLTPGSPAQRYGIVVCALWLLLWGLAPALSVWYTEPYLRQATLSLDGQSHAELEANLNRRYAAEYLWLGGLLGLIAGVIALWLRRAWQVLVLAVLVGVALVAAFDLRNGPPYARWGEITRHAILTGGIGGVLIGTVLVVVHRRSRCGSPLNS